MNELQIFNNPEFGEIRAMEIDGEPWFVGKDVAAALGYSDAFGALKKHIDEDDKLVCQIDSAGQKRDATLINRSGVYSLILSSKLPNAKKFKHWVTAEVLPTIEKHGAYMTPDTLDKMIASPEFGIRLLTALKEEQNKNRHLAAQAEADKPKVLFADSVAASHTSILIFDLAKILKQNGVDIGGNRLFDWMRKNGYLVRRKGSDYNMPTQRSMEMGLFEVKETSVSHSDGHISVNKTPKVTGKGQQYFINAFLSKR
jgi:anti-repressor protein